MKITNQDLDLLHQIFSDYVENCISGIDQYLIKGI